MRTPHLLILGLLVVSPVAAAESQPTLRIVDTFHPARPHALRFTLVNDNPFLNLFSALATEDDFGPTQGVQLAYSFHDATGRFAPNERWTIQLETHLYTRDLTPPGLDLFPNVPQQFNEVSTLGVTWDDLFSPSSSNGYYHVLGLGLGLVNDSRQNGIFAIGQQTAWHRYKHDKLTPDTTPVYANQLGTTYDYFAAGQLGIGRAFPLDGGNLSEDERNLLRVEGGLHLVGIRKGSSLYALATANRTVFRWGRNGVGVSAGARGQIAQSGDASLRGTLGIAYERPSFTLASGMTFVTGTQNESYLRFVDNDPIWHLSIEKRW